VKCVRLDRRAGFAGIAALLVLACLFVPRPAASHDANEHGSHAAKSFAAGEPGTPDEAYRAIEIVMNDASGEMAFSPNMLEVQRGEQVRFVLQNAGNVDHEFLIDTVENNARHKAAMAKNPEMQHAEPNGRRLAPGTTSELIWRFTKPGSFEIACLIPGHYEAGMRGVVVVR
jgi:uncharacterized cupredoxin-like copper-binding protein